MGENILLEWNFFATSHGKGVVDGIGGTLKKMAGSHSLRQKLRPIQSRLQMHRAFIDACQGKTHVKLLCYGRANIEVMEAV